MEMIRSEEYPAGARLPSEQQLAQRFEVSRNTVRGAIRSLSIFGLLRSINGSGTFVSERANVILEAQALASIMAHPDALLELVQARCVLEPQLAAMAARAASREEIDRLFEIVERMRGVEDHTAQINIGFSFHLELARMAHNRVLLGFLHVLREAAARHAFTGLPRSARLRAQHGRSSSHCRGDRLPRPRSLPISDAPPHHPLLPVGGADRHLLPRLIASPLSRGRRCRQTLAAALDHGAFESGSDSNAFFVLVHTLFPL